VPLDTGYCTGCAVARIFNTYSRRMHPNDGRVVSNRWGEGEAAPHRRSDATVSIPQRCGGKTPQRRDHERSAASVPASRGAPQF
jgi:hypothetical protein